MINIIYQPTVSLVGKSSVDSIEIFKFLRRTNGLGEHELYQIDEGPEALAEVAGRLCYMSFSAPRPGGREAYIKNIKRMGHGSVLEHVTANFMIAGVSRTLTHELVRHRVGMSYSQLSQRFVDSSEVAFVIPPAYIKLDIHSQVRQRWEMDCAAALETYSILKGALEVDDPNDPLNFMSKTERKKAIHESARSVLPGCTETKIFVSANLRALRHFIDLRGSLGADAEIRRLALRILMISRQEFPCVFDDFTIETREEDGMQYITSTYGSF